MKTRQLEIYAALEADISNGTVWLKQNSLPARCIVKIANETNDRTVYCEALQFDENFLARYNAPMGNRRTINDPDSSIVMGYWYRARLGDLNTSKTYSLLVKKATPFWGDVWACLHHPQLIVRMAMGLALPSVFLGLVGAVPVFWVWLRKLGHLAGCC